MSKVIDRFLEYVKIDTQSKMDAPQIPSTEKQWNLARKLAAELEAMGASDVRLSESCYVYATLPATTDKKVPAVGFIAHMDTSDACSGEHVKPQIVKGYDGGDIVLNQDLGIVMKTSDFPDMLHFKGQDLITTDGTTLLGADDKAGVAEIMTMAEYFLSNPQIPHGVIQIGFTPDEEVGSGADLFDIPGFCADVAYTVDGGEIGELEYENFNAATLVLKIHGCSIHPGSSKNKMVNAILIGMEFQAMLPAFENPIYTEGYEGFYHLNDIHGDVENARLHYIIRDHDMAKFEKKKEFAKEIAEFLNKKYGKGTVEVSITDSYYNMKEKIEPHIYLIDIAKDAMKEIGIEPIVSPIRGGTDGARLSYMGLPCPNLCTGGVNFHGKFEFISIQSMEKIVELLIKIVQKFEEK